MTQAEQQKAAKQFAEYWQDKGDEKQETQRFWIGLLGDVLGIGTPANYIEFEKKVQLKHTSFIDAYIPATKVLIEQKGAKIDLHKSYAQSDGTELTPFQQAKRYADEMPNSIRPDWIVVCNFTEFLIYNMESPHGEPTQVLLKNLAKDCYLLNFLVQHKTDALQREIELSIEAGKIVGEMYDELLKQYKKKDDFELKSLNMLCVRLVFCLYAEDSGIFGKRLMFHDFLQSFNAENVRTALIELFKILDQKADERDPYLDEKFAQFPYVNGGLFRDEKILIPPFNDAIRDFLLNKASSFDWSEISPTIFGAVFESTLNPETRRSGGMHYTSIENIHKVIDPLFMDALWEEFGEITGESRDSGNKGLKPLDKRQKERLLAFQKKLGTLIFLDPACGSGNFLTETYLSLRRLENRVISLLNSGEKVLGFDEFIQVKISQFYGIEINDFAVTVAKTALWIAESQMISETEQIVSQTIDFLPLTTNAFIVEGNALRMDWSTLQPLDPTAMPADGLFAAFTTQVDGSAHQYDYIMGNPPFVGYSLQSESQKHDILSVYVDESGKPYKSAGKIDYVSAWYFKAAELIAGSDTKAAFVSTNSVTQGEQVSSVWKPLFERFGVQIDFAWRTFRWDSESYEKARVHCVIVGFSHKKTSDLLSPTDFASENVNNVVVNKSDVKFIFDEKGNKTEARHINAYLLDADNVFIESRSKPLCAVTPMVYGNKPTDGGFLFLTEEEREEFLKKEPSAQKFIKQIYGSEEYINGKMRWCLWLVGANPVELLKMPRVMERVEGVRKFRLASPKAATQKSAETPTLFQEMRQPESGNYIIVPRVSSERRAYVPIGFLPSEIIVNDSVQIIPNATLYEFGILTSSVHMAWMRSVCGRLKSDYRYSKDIVYNNFPWCNPMAEQKTKIEQTAQAILDARAKYPECTLSQLYGENSYLFPELVKAHQANDRAVMEAYSFGAKMTEAEIVGELFKMYEELCKNAGK